MFSFGCCKLLANVFLVTVALITICIPGADAQKCLSLSTTFYNKPQGCFPLIECKGLPIFMTWYAICWYWHVFRGHKHTLNLYVGNGKIIFSMPGDVYSSLVTAHSREQQFMNKCDIMKITKMKHCCRYYNFSHRFFPLFVSIIRLIESDKTSHSIVHSLLFPFSSASLCFY